MATRTIFTNYFRAFYPHLSAPYSHNANQAAKYSIKMAFPKSGTLPATIGNGSTAVDVIMQALEEVCQEEWKVSYAQAPTVCRVQFPPEWQDGDQDWEKDEQGRLMVGTAKEPSKGMWILSAKNTSPVGVVDHTGTNDIDPGAVYSGCWCRAQLEISAYTNKEKSNIIVVSLANVQKCYDDANLGGGGNTQTAKQAFAGMVVADSNCQVGANQAGFASPAMPGATSAPAMQSAPVYEMTAAAQGYTRKQWNDAGHNDAVLIANGMMIEVKVPAPSMPGNASAPAMPGMPGAAVAPAMPVMPVATSAPAMPGVAYLTPQMPGR